jgi:CheY-like chemotaxis protein
VLLVDDNPDILSIAAATLARSCLVVGKATNGCEGLVACRSLKPDVLVLDISMPGLHGFEVARQLRTEGLSVPIVFLSVYTDETMIRAARNAGGTAYVVKSRLRSELLPAVLAASAPAPAVG